ncbi:MAG: glycine cleavage system aminomethyltransferase GcvT [Candidatus Thermoplasmatota archaeon]|jgi:aminomethyltransferase|nr:glycine cleavage system aminomethyltransferase GcvT [Candidatus Thermoplasmatota archaeon]
MAPKRTPLAEMHEEMGGSMVEFSGYYLPTHYTSITDEHVTVRTGVGVFDVSHMGNFRIYGDTATDTLDNILTQDIRNMKMKQLKYTHFLNEKGQIVDDMIIARLDKDHYFAVPNAAKVKLDWDHFNKYRKAGTVMENISDNYAIIAVQGPKAVDVMRKATTHPCEMKFFNCDYMHFRDLNKTYLVWRSGYTGEDGFELMIPNEDAKAVWRSIFKYGKEFGIKPIGLGARDTLRMEKSLLLSGQDFDFNHTSLETNVDWCVKMDHEFVGKPVLEGQKKNGIPVKFVAFHLKDRGIPRTGMEIFKDGKKVGNVTSGTMVPAKKIGLGLGYVKFGLHPFGTKLEVQIKERMVPIEIVNPRA